jgi:hypothetical protein
MSVEEEGREPEVMQVHALIQLWPVDW